MATAAGVSDDSVSWPKTLNIVRAQDVPKPDPVADASLQNIPTVASSCTPGSATDVSVAPVPPAADVGSLQGAVLIEGRTCVFCRKKKKKCDRKSPCSRCVESGVECIPAPNSMPSVVRRKPKMAKPAVDSTAAVCTGKRARKRKVMDGFESDIWLDDNAIAHYVSVPKGSSPAVDSALDDAVCEICSGGHSIEHDVLVACDGCNVTVHQSCFGIRKLPPGTQPWFCGLCARNGNQQNLSVVCFLCQQHVGAFKPMTIKGKFVHVQCAWWEPAASILDERKMEPIQVDIARAIEESRAGQLCKLCTNPGGICVQCKYEGCETFLHPRCADQQGFLRKTLEFGVTLINELYCGAHREKLSAPRDIIELLGGSCASAKPECDRLLEDLSSVACPTVDSFERRIGENSGRQGGQRHSG